MIKAFRKLDFPNANGPIEPGSLLLARNLPRAQPIPYELPRAGTVASSGRFLIVFGVGVFYNERSRDAQ